MNSALITGILGQDGSYLAKLLLSKNYRVYGVIRRPIDELSFWRLNELGIADKINFIETDLTNLKSVIHAVDKSQASEIYNLAGQSFVEKSWDIPVPTFMSNCVAVINILEAIRSVNNKIKLFQASSSEIFGRPSITPQNEETPFLPRNPYGISKLNSHLLVTGYRERYGIHACCGILYNHESPLRSIDFVSRKISYGVAKIKNGMLFQLNLGDISIKRDWGYAVDFVNAMWLMLQHEIPDDYIVATGSQLSLLNFISIAFESVGLNYEDYVVYDKNLARPYDSSNIVGDPSKAQVTLGWQTTISIEHLIKLMVSTDCNRINP